MAVVIPLATASGCDDLQPASKTTADNNIPIDVSNENQTIVQGEVKELFGKRVTNWAVLDPKTGKLLAFKWTLPVPTVQNVPSNVQSDVRFWMKVPEEFTKQTVFTGMSFDFLPHGHAPVGVYDMPHWEFHFITFTQAESVGIDCKDPTMPPDRLLPAAPGWYVLPPPDNCVPGMGLHAVWSGLPELNSERFTKSFLPDYYHGKLASLEAKAASEYIVKRESFSLPTPKSPAPAKSLLPKNLVVTWDQATDTHIWALTEFDDATVEN